MVRRFPGAVTRVVLVAAGLALVPAPLLSPSALAHPAHYRHRHPHGARVVVVSRPVVLGRPVVISGVAHGAVDFDVKPDSTEVHVDGTMRGQADQLDGHPDKLYLRPGVHRITLITPEGEKHTRKVRIVAGHEINVKLNFQAAD